MLALLAQCVRFVDHPAFVVGQFCLVFLVALLCHNIAAVAFAVAVVLTGVQQVLNKCLFMLLVLLGALEPHREASYE